MNGKNPHQTIDSYAHSATEPARQPEDRGHGRVSSWLNWGLAICTVPGAAIVMLFALGAVMSTAACTPRACPNLGGGGIDFGVAFYGAPVVAFVVIVLSFFTAKHRGGIVVPLLGWALLIADVAVMAAAVAP
jgi:hypothetical protein